MTCDRLILVLKKTVDKINLKNEKTLKKKS